MNENPIDSKRLILPKVFLNQLFLIISYLCFWSATFSLVMVTFLPIKVDEYQDYAKISGVVYILGFILFLVSRSMTKRGYKKLKQRVHDWASNVYGVDFNKKELISLITPIYGKYIGSNYQSHKIAQWYEVDNGRKEKATFSIIVVDGSPILYRDEISGEFQTEEERERQQIISVFAEEIGGNSTVYLYSGKDRNANPVVDTPTLLWSDSLRVDLFLGKDNTIDQSAIKILPVDAFFEKWVPTAVSKGIRVGINWDDNNLLFDSNKIFNL